MALTKKELKELKTLHLISIDKKGKEKLRKEARRWLKFIKFERGKFPDPNKKYNEADMYHYNYHTGEISFIEFFFNIGKKKKKIGNKNNKK